MTIDTARSPPLGGVESLLEEARERTLLLVDRVSDEDLDRVHDPLMSPLVWDLGHIAAYEDLWIARDTGSELLRPDLAELYDAFETPRAERGELAYLRRDDALAFMETVRERSLSVLGRVSPFIGEMLVQHEHQHNETMLQTLQLAEAGVYSPPRAGSGAGRERRCRAVDARSGQLRNGRARGRLRLRQRAAAPCGGGARVPDRPRPGDQRRLRRVRGRRRLRPARAVERRGLDPPRARGLGAAALLDLRRAGPALRSHRRA